MKCAEKEHTIGLGWAVSSTQARGLGRNRLNSDIVSVASKKVTDLNATTALNSIKPASSLIHVHFMPNAQAPPQLTSHNKPLQNFSQLLAREGS